MILCCGRNGKAFGLRSAGEVVCMGMEQGWKESGKEFKYLFLLGVTMAILFVVWNRDVLLTTTVLDRDELSLLKYRTDHSRLFFLCVFRERCLVVPFLFLMSTTCLASLVVYGVVVWCGVAVGTIVTIAFARYGIGGLVLVIGAGMPQYIFYMPALFIALHLSQKVRKINHRFLGQLVILEVLVLVGCLLESNINYLIVEKIVGLF